MIITVTMNPAIDATVMIDKLSVGGMNRIMKSKQDAAGKGINVSKTINQLGEQSIAMGFIAGSTGEFIESVLHSKGISTDFVRINGDTRTNTKVVEEDGTVTQLNEKGPMVSSSQFEMLIRKLIAKCDKDTLVIVSGSVPKGIHEDAYRIIIRKVHEKGARVFLDAEGELLTKALKEKPDYVKPNLDELKDHFGVTEFLSPEEIVEYGKKLQTEGVKKLIISVGNQGSLYFLDDGIYHALPLDVKVVNTVGAGDAMVAGIAYGLEKKKDPESIIRLSVAVANAMVMSEGTDLPGTAIISELEEQVKIFKVE